MQLLDFLPFFSFLPLLQPASAYKIDATCTGQDVELMRDALVQAFGMARQALDAIDQNPRDANVNRLIELLFCEEGQDPATVDMGPVRDSLAGVLDMENENPNADTEDSQFDVVVYCDLESRIEKNDRGEWVEKSINKVISDGDDGHKLSECRGTFDLTLAFTWVPGPITWTETDASGRMIYKHRNHASQINICPWFLEWSRGNRYKTWEDIRVKTQLAKWVMPLVEKGWVLTPFDATNLLDKVMLHELTHTESGQKTNDVGQGFERRLPFRAAYGWTAAKELAKMPQGDRDPSERANKNADTLALFGSAIRLLYEVPVKYVHDDGTVQTKSPNFARNAPRLELAYPRTPAPVFNPVFEGFITKIREARAMQTHVH